MLVECFERIGEYRAVRFLRAFLSSDLHLALVVLLMLAANLFSLEMIAFYLLILLGALVLLFCDDMKGVIPITLCCYMSVSYENNPAYFHIGNTRGPVSIFYNADCVLQLAFLIAVAVILLLGRLIVILMRGEKRRCPKLLIGFAALGLGYMLGGLFTEYYDLRTVVFGVAQIASLCGLYFLFLYGVDWKNTPTEHWAKVFLAIGFGLTVELLGMYVKSGILTDPTLDRGVLVTGWGMYNNVGCILAMCVPAALYLSVKKKSGWRFMLCAFVLFAAIVFTQSRSSMLFGGVVFAAGLVIALCKTPGDERKYAFAVAGAVAAALAVAVIVLFSVPVLREKVIRLFSDVFEKGFTGNGRNEIYEMAIAHFKENPFFGVGFYQCDAFRWGWDKTDEVFLAPRYHNTILQMMATGGIFCLGCYLAHRAETLVMLFRRPSLEKSFIALSIASLLLTSLAECHFFSFGPGMFYGVLLAYAEGSDLFRPAPQRE